MPPRQPQTEPPAPPTPPAGDQEGDWIQSLDSRFSAIEDRQDKQEGMLQQILSRLPGKPSSGSTEAADPDEGKPIGQLIREGVAELEAAKERKAKAEADEAERKNHADRIKKLEEAKPREVAATPAGRVRAAVQRWGFGITDTHR